MRNVRQIIFPAPRYDDAWAAIAFLERSFGFERHTIHEGADGSVVHGELRLGTASLGVTSATGPATAANPWTTVRSGVYVALPDAAAVDACHARARAAGADIAMPLQDTDYGSRQYSVWDHERHLWCFGTYTHAAPGEASLFLVLRYADRDRAVEWLGRTFGFERVDHAAAAGGRVEVTLGDGRLWIAPSDEDDARWRDDWHATHVVVPDVDAHYRRTREGGARIVSAPEMDGGRRVYYARDLEHFLWSFGDRS
jgi:uncharacterized glyoxalase superfamily protein PhnB